MGIILAAAGALLAAGACGGAGGNATGRDAASSTADVAAPGSPARTLTVPEANPAFAVGVRSYRVVTALPAGDPAASRTAVTADALDAGGAVLYTIALEQRLDLMAAWAQSSMAATGAVGSPTAAELESFLGAPAVSAGAGADASDEAKARALAGLVVASAAPGGASLTTTTIEGVCVSADEAQANVSGMQVALAACFVEIVAGVAGGPWAAAAVFIGTSLAGGVGCTSLYSLLCDQMALTYRSSCCQGADLNYANTKSLYNTVCPFGRPVPEPRACPLNPCPPGQAPVNGQCAAPTRASEFVVVRGAFGCNPTIGFPIAVNPCSGKTYFRDDGSNDRGGCVVPYTGAGSALVEGAPACRPPTLVQTDAAHCKWDLRASDGQVLTSTQSVLPCFAGMGASEEFAEPIVLDWWAETEDGRCLCGQ